VSARTEIFTAYEIRDFIIQTAGKFEAEPAYAPYFYAAVLEGGSDTIDHDNGTILDIVRIDETDRLLWPELSSETAAVAVEQSEQGFVTVSELTEAELEQLD
jgi:hypothetical protein